MTGSCAKAFVVLLGLLCHGVLRAQENPARLDSIIPLLDPAKKDTLQLTMLIRACESWSTSPKAFPFLHRLDTLSAELLLHPATRVRERARHARGAFHYFTGYHAKFERNIPRALASFQQAITDLQEGGHEHAVGECLDALGLVYGLAGAEDHAERAYRDELRIARSIGHKGLRIQALTHLAGIHAARKEYDIAWACLDSCANGSAGDSAMVLVERARIRQLQGSADDAEALLLRSLDVAGRADNAWDSLPALAPLTRLYYERDMPADGLRTARTCALLAARMGDQTAECGCINLIGDGLSRSGDHRAAEQWYRRGLALAEDIGNVGVARELGDEGSMLYALNGLRAALKAQGRAAEALEVSDRWSVLKDSVEHMNGREALLFLRFREEELRDSLEHVSSARTMALEHAHQLESERTRRYIIIGACVLAFALAIALWSRFRITRKANAAILAAQDKVVATEKQREAEQVRSRIARDVHDQLGGDLTKLSMLGSEVNASLKDDPGAVPGLVADIDRIASEAGRSLSDIVWAVEPAHDKLTDLMDRSRQFCERMLSTSGATYTVDCIVEGRDRPLDPATKRDLYLILREAVNNTVKYAQAHCIHVRFVAREQRIRLEVKDDGIGFNTANALRKARGLRNLKERAERLGGELVIASEPGAGTLVRLEVELATS
ncbi:MAG: hypothetical protein IT228_00565 [Flavobacteriales bacterium]|nr:hypothetical protein [Flavobacteriales bacterium]MCC6575812.1 hypothetical protein [Flavobacteriales bacterium]NUQ13947.1 hypothetical protein [Flavobacteriales bacterium]